MSRSEWCEWGSAIRYFFAGPILQVAASEIERFLAAGFYKDLVLEVITIVAASTITNYTGSVTNPPLEPGLQAHAWNG